MEQLAPGGSRTRRMEERHKLWPWRFDEDMGELMFVNGDEMEVYERADAGGRRSRQEKYTHIDTIPVDELCGKICSVECLDGGDVRISSLTNPAPAKDVPSCFLEVLDEWGHSWMWRNFQVSGATGSGVNMRTTTGFDWIKDSINNGSLTAVSDGSYIKQLHPELCSAAMIMECQQTRNRIIQ